MNVRRIGAVLSGLLAVTILSGCGAKEALMGPDTGWDNLNSSQLLSVAEMTAATHPQYDAGLAELTKKGYMPIEINQFGADYGLALVVCGDTLITVCQRTVKPTNDLPYVVLKLTGKPAADKVAFAGQSYLLYPAGSSHNQHYSVRCDLARQATALRPITGFSPVMASEMPELGQLVATKVAPIRNNGEYPVVNLTVLSGNIYACKLDHIMVGQLR